MSYIASSAKEGGLPIYIQMNHKNSESNWAERSRRQAYLDWCEERRAEPAIYDLKRDDEDGVHKLLQQLRGSALGIPPILCNWSSGAIAVYRAARRMGL